MFPLRCTVRGCDLPLTAIESGLRCEAGHSFDRAREGYFNLSQPQDSRSKNPGDSDEAVLARQRWIQQGHMVTFTDYLAGCFADCHVDDSTVVDLGCGEGSFGKQLFANSTNVETSTQFCGIDLSKRAIRLAARQWDGATWILANADRTLPVVSESVSCVMSLFGRRPLSEVHRVLRPGGHALFAVPGEFDMIELREQVQQSGQRRDRMSAITAECVAAGLSPIKRFDWRHQCTLVQAELQDVMAMSYRAFRHSEQARLAVLDQAEVTLHAELLLLQKAA